MQGLQLQHESLYLSEQRYDLCLYLIGERKRRHWCNEKDSAEHRDLYALMLEQTARVITVSRGADELWLCGAEIPMDSENWRGMVDAVS